MTKIMMLKAGTIAILKDGTILDNETDDAITIQSEDGDYYIGHFCQGFGFIDTKFKKEDCRNLTQEEINKYNRCRVFINGTAIGTVKINSEGYFI